MKRILLLIVICLLLINSGCVYRKLTVKSNPPDATLYFNDKRVGETPVDFDFLWYASHKIRLEKPGYQTLEVREPIKTPLYLWVPFDFVAEVLPLRFEDFRELSYELSPVVIEELPSQ